MEEFRIKKGDTRPVLEAILRGSDDDPRDLSNAAGIEFHMADSETGDIIVNSPATIVTASEGRVQYEWASGDTDSVGLYMAEFEVSYDDGSTETFPNYGTMEVRISEGLV